MNPVRKTLIYFGLGNLFLIIIFITYLLYFNVNNDENNKVYNSNFESVDYAKNLLKSVVSINAIQTNYFFNPEYKFERKLYEEDVLSFKKYLDAQNENITEKGEKEISLNLRLKFDRYIKTFDSLLIQNNHQQKLYFSKLLPLQDELRASINGIYVANFYAMMSKNSLLKQSINKVIISLIIFFELILFFVLYRFANSVYINTPKTNKNGPKRDSTDYPKYFTSKSN